MLYEKRFLVNKHFFRISPDVPEFFFYPAVLLHFFLTIFSRLGFGVMPGIGTVKAGSGAARHTVV